MPFFDLPLEELRRYRSSEPEPADFDTFWRRTLEENETSPLNATFEPVDQPLYRLVDVFDVTFCGYGGERIKAWFLEPAGNSRPLPCLVTYAGYGVGRAYAADHLVPVAAGFAVFAMDTRGQGCAAGRDYTPPDGAATQYAGFMTTGIESRETYYYRGVFVDAERAIAVAASHPHVDENRIAVTGGSQGGGITLAAAALAAGHVKLAMPDVPFLCHWRRATTLTDKLPYREIANYLQTRRDRVDEVFETLAYFDGVNFAARIGARCLFSVGLMDDVCPPSTVFAAYNRVASEKDIVVYEFNEHEGGAQFHLERKLRFAREYL